ncbi:hypothetical protein EZ313_03560 [Ramlibacter henchirensis]|uniref:Uncharacterized protein n=1 Tax=Ramlibacter henchirensis TaxID=204072 RepID=A0A4Z0C2H2_9BURK|nr:hypothetical protein [Ramlibacter henchirensis]TFZ05746.1 hypothetical protein EZ313_03560 [Ramlibacter henchirensis]
MSPRAVLPSAFAVLAVLSLPGGAHAFGSCSSDGQFQPAGLLERFISADCEACWTARDTRRPRQGELALDWIVPGSRGDDAPLSAAATRDAQTRLLALRRKPPATSDAVHTAREAETGALRVAIGPAFNGYVGTSIESQGAGEGPFTAWLALVETLPAGVEGTPVERNLVRNLLQVSWPAQPGVPRFESRPMSIPQGARPERLRVVGWVQDSQGRIRAISESRCDPEEQKR